MAEKALAVDPGNFETLRIAALSCVELGKPVQAKAFAAQMLLNAPMSDHRIVRVLIWLAFTISWVPIIRKARKKALNERQADREWVEWASNLLNDAGDQERSN